MPERPAGVLVYLIIPWLRYNATMVDDFLFCDWDEPPEALAFENSYRGIIERCERLAASLGSIRASAGAVDPESWSEALDLYVSAPAIVNVALNYSVCVQFGLPLHPTVYFEVDPAAARSGAGYGEAKEAAAFSLLGEAIGLARAAYRLDDDFPRKAAAYLDMLPDGLSDFVYTSVPDKYTWRAAEPAKVRSLAASVQKRGSPALVVGAAHGSIMAGLLLSELLGSRLWFLRFSMFKRNDKEPVVSKLDEELIRSHGDGSDVLVFDEDSASGTTMSILSERVKRMAPKARTATVIRHLSSSFKPDHVGKTWWD